MCSFFYVLSLLSLSCFTSCFISLGCLRHRMLVFGSCLTFSAAVTCMFEPMEPWFFSKFRIEKREEQIATTDSAGFHRMFVPNAPCWCLMCISLSSFMVHIGALHSSIEVRCLNLDANRLTEASLVALSDFIAELRLAVSAVDASGTSWAARDANFNFTGDFGTSSGQAANRV